MPVYVDDMAAPFGRMRMSHMLADSTEELLGMADRIGVARKWLQKAGQPGEHFDVCQAKKKLAIEAGAREITRKQAGEIVRGKRKKGRQP